MGIVRRILSAFLARNCSFSSRLNAEDRIISPDFDNFRQALRRAGVFLAAALLIAAGFTGCAGGSGNGGAAVRPAAVSLANLPEPGREPGRQVPDGAFPGRISPSERVFIGKVLNIQWGTGDVSRMGAPGKAEVECVRAFRGVQAGQRVIVTVFKPLWRAYGEATLEMTIFSNGGADVRPGDQWLFLLGGFEKTDSANPDIPGETQVGALAYCPKGDEPVIAETEQAIALDSLAPAERFAALAALLKRGGLTSAIVGPYAVSQIFALRALDGPAAARTLAAALRDATNGVELRTEAPPLLAELAQEALSAQPGAKPDTDLNRLARQLLLESAPDLEKAEAEIAESYAFCVADMGPPNDLQLAQPALLAAALRALVQRDDVAGYLRGATVGTAAGVHTQYEAFRKVLNAVAGE
ncbi:MAG: hypothetical protein ABSA67_08825 [Candidatus Brocadiia bacterium]